MDIHIFKAQTLRIKEKTMTDLNIIFDREIPDLKLGKNVREALNEQGQIFQKEAAALEDALYCHLPGGTYDALLRAILLRKTSHFVVAHEEIK